MRELFRKIFHIGFGLAIAGVIYFLPQGTALGVLVLGTFVGLFFIDAILKGYHIPGVTSLVHNLEREGNLPGKGALFFAVSCLFCAAFFPVSIVVPAIVAFSLLDGVATIVGQRYGRHPIVNNKTAEGTLAGMALTFCGLLFLLPPLSAVLAVIVAGAVELFSPVDDNLLIPPVVCIVLTLAGMV